MAGFAFSFLFNTFAQTSPSLAHVPTWCSGFLSVGSFATMLLIVHSVVIRLADMRYARPPPPADSPTEGGSFADKFSNIDDIAKWLATDDAVDTLNQDWFGHDDVARRIVRRLTTAGDDDAPTMAVVGRLGSGKTTIGKLVKSRLGPYPRLRMIQLSLWPYESSAAAQRGVLSRLIDEIATHVNVLGVRGLPGNYISTVEKAAGLWGAFASLFRTAQDPKTVLSHLSDILAAIDIRIVLWIEDLERFAGTSPQVGDEPLPRDTERVAHVRALLYLLDKCERISVIVADTTLSQRIDIHKIARYVERIPPLSTPDVWRVVGALRTACLPDPSSDIIDPANPESRKDLDPPSDGALAMRYLLPPGAEPDANLAIADILDTPRLLKSTLRLTYDTWKALVGEIDFDDVLVASAIRAAYPDEFSFIDEHIDVFRTDFTQGSSFENDPTKHTIAATFKDRLEKIRLGKAIASLTRSMFPGLPAPRPTGGVDVSTEYVKKPQGLLQKRPVDYWARYLSVPEVSEESSDQAALRSIKSWRCGDDNDLVSRLVDDPSRADQVETFVRMFKPTELCRLLEDVAERLQSDSAAGWGELGDAPGVIPLWRMMRQRRPNKGELARVLVGLIERFTPIHLPLSFSLFRWVGCAETRESAALLDATSRRLVTSNLSNALRVSFPRGSAKTFLEALKGGTPYLMRDVINYIDKELGNAAGERLLGGQTEFSHLLLDVAEVDPSIGMVQILSLIVDSTSKHRTKLESGEPVYTGEYAVSAKKDRAGHLFPIGRLVTLLKDIPKPTGLDSPIDEMWDAAVEFARNYKAPPETETPP